MLFPLLANSLLSYLIGAGFSKLKSKLKRGRSLVFAQVFKESTFAYVFLLLANGAVQWQISANSRLQNELDTQDVDFTVGDWLLWYLAVLFFDLIGDVVVLVVLYLVTFFGGKKAQRGLISLIVSRGFLDRSCGAY